MFTARTMPFMSSLHSLLSLRQTLTGICFSLLDYFNAVVCRHVEVDFFLSMFLVWLTFNSKPDYVKQRD